MAFFLSCHGANLYGGERVLLALARGLRGRGHRVVLELPHDGPALPAAREIDGVEVLVSGRPRLPRNLREGLLYLAGAPRAAWRLRRAIRAGGFDVVWVNSLMNPLAGAAARAAGTAVVWHLHERNFSGPAGWAAALWIRACAHVPLAVSTFVAASFQAHRPLRRRIAVLPNALLDPITAMPPRPPDGRLVVACVGQLEPRKRVTDVLEAVASMPEAVALLVGDGKARPAVEQAARRLGLRDRVRFAGFQPDIRPWLRDADCVVLPARDEPFGLIALEAMAAGRPVVAARSGAHPEVLGDAALYYPMGDPVAMADRLRRLAADPALAADLRDRGLERVRAYTLDQLIAGVETTARRALAARARRTA